MIHENPAEAATAEPMALKVATEQTAEQALQQASHLMHISAMVATQIVAETSRAICKQLQECQSIDELADIIRKLREASA